MQDVRPAEVRYIKLGPGSAWLNRCLEEGFLLFSDTVVPHELARAGDWEEAEGLYVAQGKWLGKARDLVRENREFYTQGSDCLWVTFGRGRLWWAFAEPDVLEGDEPGLRVRRTRGPWRDSDLKGQPLAISSLSTRLTKTFAYRQTICGVEAEDYLLFRLNAREDPLTADVRAMQHQLVVSAEALIRALDWRDFELLVDLLFARGGWRRVSAVGGEQADVDLVVEQPITGERGFVQVKSSADQAVFSDYLQRFRADGAYQRFFFACHSPTGVIAAPEDASVHIWQGAGLAKQAIDAGLLDWLISRTQ